MNGKCTAILWIVCGLVYMKQAVSFVLQLLLVMLWIWSFPAVVNSPQILLNIWGLMWCFACLNKLISFLCLTFSFVNTIQCTYEHYKTERGIITFVLWRLACETLGRVWPLYTPVAPDTEVGLFSNYADCVLWKEMLNRPAAIKWHQPSMFNMWRGSFANGSHQRNINSQ